MSPARGTRTTAFTVIWASATAPSGYVYDIQIKRPGTTGFVSWKAGRTARLASFTPDRGTGTYGFRAAREDQQRAEVWVLADGLRAVR